MKSGLIHFHQGWSDIVNCLSLITFYRKTYDYLYVLARDDAREIYKFYTRTLDNVKVIFLKTDDGRFYGQYHLINGLNVNYIPSNEKNFHGVIQIGIDVDFLFHGEHDINRKDNHRHKWYNNLNYKPDGEFIEKFYTLYDIDYIERINSFEIERDFALEDKTYMDFVKEFGDKYVIYHDNPNWNYVPQNISTKIEFEDPKEGFNYVNLNKKSLMFFDYIKIFQKADEIHLIDSIWACLYYQIDAKYKLFEDKTINIYAQRGHAYMFEYPIKLENWKIN